MSYKSLTTILNAVNSFSISQPPIHSALLPISWLLGKWKGHGKGVFPTIKPFEYNEEICFDHFGGPIMTYKLVDNIAKPSHR